MESSIIFENIGSAGLEEQVNSVLKMLDQKDLNCK
jgi:hypothetical protein